MSLESLNRNRTINYVIMLVLLIIFTASLYSINFIYPKDREKKEALEKSPTLLKIRKVGRFLIPFVTLLSFFSACVVVAYIIADGSNDMLAVPLRPICWYLLSFINWGNPYSNEFYSIKRT